MLEKDSNMSVGADRKFRSSWYQTVNLGTEFSIRTSYSCKILIFLAPLYQMSLFPWSPKAMEGPPYYDDNTQIQSLHMLIILRLVAINITVQESSSHMHSAGDYRNS